MFFPYFVNFDIVAIFATVNFDIAPAEACESGKAGAYLIHPERATSVAPVLQRYKEFPTYQTFKQLFFNGLSRNCSTENQPSHHPSNIPSTPPHFTHTECNSSRHTASRFHLYLLHRAVNTPSALYTQSLNKVNVRVPSQTWRSLLPLSPRLHRPQKFANFVRHRTTDAAEP